MNMFCRFTFSAVLFITCAGLALADEHRDVAYGPATAQRMDIYLPEQAHDVPAIMMVHGGAWRIGDKEMGRVVDHKRERWLPRGIAFISINYRMLPEADPLEQARDVAQALVFVQKNAATWGIDRRKIVLMGHSAGAHLVALLAAAPELPTEKPAPWLANVLLDSGALDVPAIMENRHFRLYDEAFGNDPAFWRSASPTHRLHAAIGPTLVVCSSRRRDSCAQAQAFSARAREFGSQIELAPEAMSHGEINAELGSDAAYTGRVENFLRTLDPALALRLPR